MVNRIQLTNILLPFMMLCQPALLALCSIAVLMQKVPTRENSELNCWLLALYFLIISILTYSLHTLVFLKPINTFHTYMYTNFQPLVGICLHFRWLLNFYVSHLMGLYNIYTCWQLNWWSTCLYVAVGHIHTPFICYYLFLVHHSKESTIWICLWAHTFRPTSNAWSILWKIIENKVNYE